MKNKIILLCICSVVFVNMVFSQKIGIDKLVYIHKNIDRNYESIVKDLTTIGFVINNVFLQDDSSLNETDLSIEYYVDKIKVNEQIVMVFSSSNSKTNRISYFFGSVGQFNAMKMSASKKNMVVIEKTETKDLNQIIYNYNGVYFIFTSLYMDIFDEYSFSMTIYNEEDYKNNF